MTREQARQEIRDRIKCTDYLKKSPHGNYCCPYCKSGTGPKGTGAVKYYPETNTFCCHGCKKTGDVIDLYQQETGKDYSAALEDLAALAGLQLDPAGNTASRQVKQPHGNFSGSRGTDVPENGETQQRPGKCPTEAADFSAYYEASNAYLIGPEGEAGREYLNRRGILSTALFYKLGFDPVADPAGAPGAMGDTHRPHPCPRIIIPCSSGHYVARSIDPETPPQYAKLNPARSKGATAPAIFNMKALYTQEVQEIFVAEGAIDALSIMEVAGEDRAIGLNSANNAGALIEKLEDAPTTATLIICLDNDERGKKATQEVQEGLQRLQIPFITADITGGCKDPNEALTADRNIFVEAVQDAIAEARAYKEKLQREAQREQEERQQRTGASMIDAFLQTVKSEKYKPMPTGITDIDSALYGGFTRQTLVLLGAAPGAGKTALASWVFENMAKAGHSVLFLNLEMSREQILARSLSRIARQQGENITPAEIKQGYKWDLAQEIIVKAAAEEYKKTIAPRMIYNPDGVTADLDSILAYLEEEAQRAEDAGMPAPLVVIDYLQLIGGREREDSAAIIKRAVYSLKAFAIRHNSLVFCIMANNRPSNQTGTVTQESGRDTSALEYSADIMFGLSYTHCLKRPGQDRKAKEELTPEEMKYVTLQILKGRDARIGAEVDLFFDGQAMTYTQLAKYQEAAVPKQGRILKK